MRPIALLAGLALTGTAAAADLHVAPHGDDTAPGDVDRPLQTLRAALERAQPGDRVLLAAGQHDGASLRAGHDAPLLGTDDAPITIAPAPGAEGAVTLRAAPGDAACLRIDGAAHIQVEGLGFVGCAVGACFMGTYHVTLRESWSVDPAHTAGVIVRDRSHDVTLEANVFPAGAGGARLKRACGPEAGDPLFVSVGGIHIELGAPRVHLRANRITSGPGPQASEPPEGLTW